MGEHDDGRPNPRRRITRDSSHDVAGSFIVANVGTCCPLSENSMRRANSTDKKAYVSREHARMGQWVEGVRVSQQFSFSV